MKSETNPKFDIVLRQAQNGERSRTILNFVLRAPNLIFFVLLCLSTFFLYGCGTMSVIRTSDWAVPKPLSVQIRLKEGLSYWPEMQPDSKDRFFYALKKELEKASISVVESKPDIILLITDVKISESSANYSEIERLAVAAIGDEGELFRVVYRQRPPLMPEDLFKYLVPKAGPEEMARTLGRKIIRELKNK